MLDNEEKDAAAPDSKPYVVGPSHDALLQAKFAMDHAGDCILWVNYDGRLVYANNAASSTLGYTKDELLKMSIFDVDPDFSASGFEQHKERVQKEGSMRFESRHRTKAGRIFPVEVTTNYYDFKGNFLGIAFGRDISERKQAEDALRASEEKYRAIFNNAPLGIFRSTFSGRFVEINPSMARMFGYANRQEMLSEVGERAESIYADPTRRQRLLSALLSSPEGLSEEVEYRRKDGTTFQAVIRVSLHFDEAARPCFLDGTLEDVTERKRSEELLRQSEEKFSTLFRLMPDKILLIDLETMTIADVNEAFAFFTGYSRAEVLGRTPGEFRIFENNFSWRELADLIKTEGRLDNLELKCPNRERSLCDVSLSGRMVSFGSKPYLLLIGRDITEAKRMQAMMVQTEKMLSVGGIAAGVAHEINNPLGIVLQAAQNLKQRVRPDFHKNKVVAEAMGLDLDLMARYMAARKLDVFVDDIQSGIQRAARTVQRMLNFSRRSESHRSLGNIRTIVENALAFANNDFDLKRCYDFKKIRLTVSIAEALPDFYCSATEIEQVLLNLLRNSAQAMAEVVPPLAEPCIEIRVTAVEGWLRLEVQDNGPGMSEELRKRVMEPFFTTKKPGIGTGLGLSVSSFIVTTGHQGRFSVSSTPGQGTLFTIELPTEATQQRLL